MITKASLQNLIDGFVARHYLHPARFVRELVLASLSPQEKQAYDVLMGGEGRYIVARYVQEKCGWSPTHAANVMHSLHAWGLLQYERMTGEGVVYSILDEGEEPCAVQDWTEWEDA